MKDCTTCKYGYEDERLGIPMCHHPKRFSEDCVDFNMHEEKDIKEAEKNIPNDLEEAAENYIRKVVDTAGHPGWDWTTQDITDAFIAGAKWDREQHKSVPGKYAEMDFESARNTFSEDVYNHNRKNKTPIDMVDLDDAFETGADWMEKQMMKEAVEGEIMYNPYPTICLDDSKDYKLKFGDKVRVIIVKED